MTSDPPVQLPSYLTLYRIVETNPPTVRDFLYELDNGRDGHCTIWGEPDALRALVASVRHRSGGILEP